MILFFKVSLVWLVVCISGEPLAHGAVPSKHRLRGVVVGACGEGKAYADSVAR